MDGRTSKGQATSASLLTATKIGSFELGPKYSMLEDQKKSSQNKN